ncbi:MAG: SIS domain-containing protein [Nocardioidaceae bacterium]
MADTFDDGRLDDPEVLASYDAALRHLAESGARVRIDAGSAADALDAAIGDESTPRAIVAAGVDARLLRAVLEPWCPVPFVAWPGPGLPGWAGALDLVVVLGPGSGDPHAASAVRDAIHRGCSLLTACQPDSPLAEQAQGRHSTVLPIRTGDSLAAAVVMLLALHRLEVGPAVDAEEVARVLDDVAVACSPARDIAVNPAKDLAIAFADLLPLVWGGSVLAARAARRVAETIRRSTGRAALAADESRLIPVISAARSRDLFADPFAEPESAPSRPGLLVLDDGAEEPTVRAERGRLAAEATAHEVRMKSVHADEGTEISRYAALLSTGAYAARYLGVGLDSGGARHQLERGDW